MSPEFHAGKLQVRLYMDAKAESMDFPRLALGV
jgi:hypothetical protein